MVISEPPLVVSKDGNNANKDAGGRYSKTAEDLFQKKLTRLLVTPMKTVDFEDAGIGLEQVSIEDERTDALTTVESNLQASVLESRQKFIPTTVISV